MTLANCAHRGFSLIELLITMTILGLLASLAAPPLEMAVKRHKEQELHTALREIREAIDAYKRAVDEGKVTRMADESGYPPNLSVLYLGVPDAKDPNKKKKILFLRRMPRDPFYPDATVDASGTWGKRSYDSDYDKPQAGKDVFDVYSLSPETALNGSLYREW